MTHVRNHSPEFVIGSCLAMCPRDEIKMRERERLLHVLEMVKGTEKDKYPKADPKRTVKEFARSAAGKTIDASQLRPTKILVETINYLLCDVANASISWHKVYDFITDRLRAVRQDMVVQNLPIADTIAILQPIVKFHAYSAYKLCNEERDNFDPVLNDKHLQECLKRLLHCYDDFQGSNSDVVRDRDEFEAIYVVFNLGNDEALNRAILRRNLFKSKLLTNALHLSLCFKSNNFVRFYRTIDDLPPLLIALASLHIQKLRKKAFQMMATAYNSKLLKYPSEKLKVILFYESIDEMHEDCKYFGLHCDETGINFRKDSFKDNQAARKQKHYKFVNDKLGKESLQKLLQVPTLLVQ